MWREFYTKKSQKADFRYFKHIIIKLWRKKFHKFRSRNSRMVQLIKIGLRIFRISWVGARNLAKKLNQRVFHSEDLSKHSLYALRDYHNPAQKLFCEKPVYPYAVGTLYDTTLIIKKLFVSSPNTHPANLTFCRKKLTVYAVET